MNTMCRVLVYVVILCLTIFTRCTVWMWTIDRDREWEIERDSIRTLKHSDFTVSILSRITVSLLCQNNRATMLFNMCKHEKLNMNRRKLTFGHNFCRAWFNCCHTFPTYSTGRHQTSVCTRAVQINPPCYIYMCVCVCWLKMLTVTFDSGLLIVLMRSRNWK